MPPPPGGPQIAVTPMGGGAAVGGGGGGGDQKPGPTLRQHRWRALPFYARNMACIAIGANFWIGFIILTAPAYSKGVVFDGNGEDYPSPYGWAFGAYCMGSAAMMGWFEYTSWMTPGKVLAQTSMWPLRGVMYSLLSLPRCARAHRRRATHRRTLAGPVTVSPHVLRVTHCHFRRACSHPPAACAIATRAASSTSERRSSRSCPHCSGRCTTQSSA
jgi:hypothetical protein